MNIFTFGLLLATSLWSFFFDTRLLHIFTTVVLIYIALELWSRSKSNMSVRKKIAIATWNDTGDPTVFGKLEIQVEKIDAFLASHNKKNPDNQLNYTHVILKAMGYATAQNKKTLGKICFGNYIPAESVDLSVFVDFNEKSMVDILVKDCKNSSLSNIGHQVAKATAALNNKETKADIDRKIKFVDRIPTFLISIIINVLSFISYNVGISLPMIGLRKNHFGFGIVADVSRYGITDLTLPLCNFARSVFVAVVNAPYDKVVVVDDQLVTKRVLNLGIAFDHRFADGSDAMTMLKNIEHIWNEPEKFV